MRMIRSDFDMFQDFHFSGGQVFWTDSVEKRLYRAKLSDKDSTRSVVVEDDVKRTDDIAVGLVSRDKVCVHGSEMS